MSVLEKVLEEIKDLKKKQNSSNQDYATGYLSALSTVEGIISGVKENDGWIPVEEKLPEEGELVKVTVHSSKWIGDFDSNWVPEEDRIYHPEEYHVYDGYLSKNGIWIFYDEEHSEATCEKEFGTDKGRVYDVVTAWMPIEHPNPYKGE